MTPAVLVALLAAGPADPDARFRAEVRPLLAAKCVACHGPDQHKGGLRVDSRDALLKGGDGGPAVVPGKPDDSPLVRAVRHADDVAAMPPKEKLPDAQVAALADWVKAGAVWPADAAGQAAPGRGDAWTDPANPVRVAFRGKRLDLWSLKPVRRPGVPDVRSIPHEVRNDIDRFVLARLAGKGLGLSPEADRRTLLRRLSFDLIGLPPTTAEVDAFVNDQSPDAYEKQVDRLLASPHYGERWGRYWLDVVRYADTNGFERDEFRPDMWRYRDYVVRSLNADTPFDRFVTEQLAGDELGGPDVKTPADADRWAATGFLRLGPVDSTASLFEEEKRGRDELLADLTNTTAAAFLGLTFSCCQCHDHKYDPLLQADHYRLRAFFAGVKPKDDHDVGTGWAAVARRYNAALDDTIKAKQAERKELLKATGKKTDDEAKKALGEDAKKRYEALKKEVADLEGKKRPVPRAAVMTDSGKDAPPTFVLAGGDYRQPKGEVPPGFPSALDPAPVVPTKTDRTTGRRLALARWLTDPNNPLTARVVVNRLWQGHFGRGIVATPNDFGYSGARPTHPELLDWLASELSEKGWSLKAVHRLLLLSATYRQASVETPAQRKADPENLLLGRQNPRRLDAEATRDALLFVSGRLRPDAGGPPRWPAVPEELLNGQPGILEAIKGEDGGRRQGWYTSPDGAADVRSLYLIQKRALPVPFLQPFDLPDPTTSCGCRGTTTVAPQALTLLNSPDAARLVKAFADRAAGAGGDPVTTAFRLALGRPPDAEEARLAADLLKRHTEQYRAAGQADAARKALADLCRAVVNLNEFVYVD